MESRRYGLFITQSLTEPAQDALDRLAAAAGYDAFTMRQKLKGFGVSMIRAGEKSEIVKLSASFLKEKIQPCCVDLSKSPIKAARLSAAATEEKGLLLEYAGGSVKIDRTNSVLIIAADLSLSAVKRTLERRFSRASAEAEEREILEEVFAGVSIVELYVFSSPQSSAPIAAVRTYAGKFNCSGLEGERSYSAAQNLRRLVEAVKLAAGSYELDYNFGFATLPECAPSYGTDQRQLDKNEDAFKQYAWYILQIYQDVKTKRTAGAANSAPAVSADTSSSSVTGTMFAAAAIAALAAEDENEDKRKKLPVINGRKPLPAPPPPLNPQKSARLSLPGAMQAFIVVLFTFFPMLAFFFFDRVKGGGPGAEAAGDFGVVAFYWFIDRGLLFLGLSSGCIYGSFYFLRLKRWIENTPTSKIRSMAMGMVEIKGIGERIYEVLSPLTMAPCVWWQLSRYKKDRSGNKEHWKLVSRQNSDHVAFAVRDETGAAIVAPYGCSMSGQRKQVYHSNSSNALFNLFIAADERYEEELIVEGAPIYVLGFATPRSPQNLNMKTKILEKLRLLKSDRETLMRKYDLNGDGQIDQGEWSAAVTDAETESLKDELKKQDEKRGDGFIDAVISKSAHKGQPFIIAQGDEAELTRNYGVFSALLFVLASGLLIYGLFRFV